ncbi:MAG: hypothetical protein GY815_19430, partial [Gammaproteobacteria bacterium]|nr:hypothetical protein [Gammaproteobacteria bacterium]
ELMEGGEGTIDKEQNASEQNKIPKKIRVAIFFDGTLNNRINVEEREKDSEIYQKYGDPEDGESSYDNGRTNIAIMEPHVFETADGFDHCMKVYVEGQGTFNLKGDSDLGAGFGGGGSGVATRADDGIKQAVIEIDENGEIKPAEHFIEKLTLDVFGFSRGAAAARYAIHVMFNGRIQQVDQYSGEILYAFEPIHVRLNNFGYDIEVGAVEVRFAGLYDTVLSYYGSQLFPFSSNVL